MEKIEEAIKNCEKIRINIDFDIEGLEFLQNAVTNQSSVGMAIKARIQSAHNKLSNTIKENKELIYKSN